MSMNSPEIEPYALIPDFLDRSAEDLMQRELKFWPRSQWVLGKMLTLVPKNIIADPEDVERMQSYEGSFVFASNHEDDMDILVNGIHAYEIGHGSVAYLSKRELMEEDLPGFVARIFHHNGAIPTQRGGSEEWRAKVNEVLCYILEVEGRSVVVYVSGSRGKGIEVAKPGALHIAFQADVEYVPVGVAGTEGAARNLKKRKRGTFAISYGEPVSVEDPKSTEELEFMKRAITHQMQRAQKLLS